MAQKGLLVVDMQRGFSPSPMLATAIQSRYIYFDKIILTRFFNVDGSLFQKELGYHEMQPNTFQSELVVSVPGQGEVHDHYGTYGMPVEFVEYVKSLDRHWTVTGTDVDGCVAALCFQLWDAQVTFEIDHMLVGTSGGPAQKDAGMRVLQRQFARRV